jgi:nitrate reductase beta subunit
VRQCPGRVRHLGHLDDRKSNIYKLVKKWKVALPLRPDFEVEPNVFYVPPTLPTAFDENGEFDEEASRMPMEDLRDLFGPEVDQALATIQTERDKVAAGGQSELMDMLIAHDWNDLLGPYTEDPGMMDPPRPPSQLGT